MKAQFRWRESPTQAYDATRYVRAVDNAVGSLLEYWAAKVETSAKVDASWTDRTGNARQTLAAFAVKVEKRRPVQAVMVTDGERLVATAYTPGIGGWSLILRQGMSYGKNLELDRGGRFAVVVPTLQGHYTLIWNSVRGLVK
jgi:hypothetical protein